MASTNKTEKLKLNLWTETDRPQRADFNNDNVIIEEALGGHVNNDSIHLTEQEKSRVSAPVIYTGYSGNGQSSREVSLPCEATAVIVFCDSTPSAVLGEGCVCNYRAVAMAGAGACKGLTLSSSKLTVTQDTVADNGAKSCFNESGRQYRVMIFR